MCGSLRRPFVIFDSLKPAFKALNHGFHARPKISCSSLQQLLRDRSFDTWREGGYAFCTNLIFFYCAQDVHKFFPSDLNVNFFGKEASEMHMFFELF